MKEPIFLDTSVNVGAPVTIAVVGCGQRGKASIWFVLCNLEAHLRR